MNNILKSPSPWLFIFLCFLLTGCFEEDDPEVPYNPDSSSKHVNVNVTNDAQLYNDCAGVYDLTLELLTDSFSYETGEYVYDKIAKSEVAFGDNEDRMARFQIPVKIFGYIVASEEERNSLLNSNEHILIESPYTIRLWNFSEYNINPKETIYDCEFNTNVNGFAFDIGDKQYVLTIRIAYKERSWTKNRKEINYPDVIDGIGFYYVTLLCNGQNVPLEYNGQPLNGSDGAYPFKFVGNWLGEHHPFSVLKDN